MKIVRVESVDSIGELVRVCSLPTEVLARGGAARKLNNPKTSCVTSERGVEARTRVVGKAPHPMQERNVQVLRAALRLHVAVPVHCDALQDSIEAHVPRRREDDDRVNSREAQIVRVRVVALDDPPVVSDELTLDDSKVVGRCLNPAWTPVVLVEMKERQSDNARQLLSKRRLARASTTYDRYALHNGRAYPASPFAGGRELDLDGDARAEVRPGFRALDGALVTPEQLKAGVTHELQRTPCDVTLGQVMLQRIDHALGQ